MAQITYTNKVALNENPEIADINKVTDDDMNEIKQVVNDNYNNTIQITNTEPTDSDNKIWIDTGEVGSAVSEITNEYSTSTGLGYSANYVNNLHTYSTTEQRIGTWIDGKPLYRITITGTLNTTNGVWKDFPLFTANYIDNVVSMIGMIKIGSGNYGFWSIPFTRLTDSAFSNREYAYMNYNKSTANFSIVAYHPNSYATVYSGKTFFATLEYTKTTD